MRGRRSSSSICFCCDAMICSCCRIRADSISTSARIAGVSSFNNSGGRWISILPKLLDVRSFLWQCGCHGRRRKLSDVVGVHLTGLEGLRYLHGGEKGSGGEDGGDAGGLQGGDWGAEEGQGQQEDNN